MPIIEEAKGILMAQRGCSPDEAFDLLRRASQRFNVPVRVLAARLVYGVQRLGPQAAQVVHETLRDSHAAPTLEALLDEVLEFALTLLRAEQGNVQLADPATGTLRIAAQRGFGPEFVAPPPQARRTGSWKWRRWQGEVELAQQVRELALFCRRQAAEDVPLIGHVVHGGLVNDAAALGG